MADENAPTDAAEARRDAAAEAARTRRRWLTLAEVLGVAALVISALTLWNNYKQRSTVEAEKAAAEAQKAAEARQLSAASRNLLLRAEPARDGGSLILSPANPSQTIQTQTVAFPTALSVAPVETVSQARIEAAWFGRPLARAVGDTEGQRGDARLPVAITTHFFSGAQAYSDTAIYDIGYRIDEGGLLGGHRVRLRGLSRVETVAPDRAQARVDALWQARRPAGRD